MMRRRRRSLTTTFAVVSLLSMAALGAALVGLMSNLMKAQALDEAIRTAGAYASAGVDEKVPLTEWQAENLSPATIARLRTMSTATSGFRIDDTLLAVRLWSNSGRALFDSDPMHVGGFPDVNRLDSAVRYGVPSAAIVGQVSSDSTSASPYVTPGPSSSARPQATSPSPGASASSSSRPGSESTPGTLTNGFRSDVRNVVDVYVPAQGHKNVGAIEIVLNYDATEAATTAAVRNVATLVLAGLAVLWILLFRTVRGASRRLRLSASENARLALLDPLTGLPNRRLLSERLERAVDRAIAEDNHVGLLLLDIDRFKEINDSLGHDRGDLLLIDVARRLEEVVRETDTVARLGGDEFAVLLPTVRSIDDAAVLAERVLSVFSEPYDIDGLVLHVESSLGLALLPDHAADVSALMKRADIAMYAAKAARRGMSIYSADGDGNSPAKLVLLGDLRKALDVDDQLSVHYQPKLNLNTGEVAGLEALLRWHHPKRGLIPPSDFIPLAEQTGLIHTLTQRVLELVLSQLRDWSVGGWDIQVAVNLSALNLAEPDLDVRIGRMLEEYGVPAHLLEFEITESAIVQDPERAAQVLQRIADMGSTIALDDFGIGNTSISQLRSLPIDTLKIDQSFVTDMTEGGEVLVKVVTDLAHEFRMVAVAEGVEQPEVAEKLRRLGCDLAQGYLYARPVSAADLGEVLARLGVKPAAVPAAAADLITG
ncbi:MAG TPA: EAL domain-containing protein [Candidatus Nanopelagicales bacterium]|jgi:diguanylate cyclase (GGDEF)-like protein